MPGHYCFLRVTLHDSTIHIQLDSRCGLPLWSHAHSQQPDVCLGRCRALRVTVPNASLLWSGCSKLCCVTRRKLQTPGNAEEHNRQETPTINPISPTNKPHRPSTKHYLGRDCLGRLDTVVKYHDSNKLQLVHNRSSCAAPGKVSDWRPPYWGYPSTSHKAPRMTSSDTLQLKEYTCGGQ